MVISSQAVFYASEIVLPTDVVVIKVMNGVLSYSNTVSTRAEGRVPHLPQIQPDGGILQNGEVISSPLQTPNLPPDDLDGSDSYYSDYS